MDLKECFEKELLKKDIPDIEKAKKSIEIARHKLENANKALNAQIFEDAVIDAYTSMFHASRAILFKDGIKERSHYAIYVYLKEKYKDKLEPRFLNELNSLRMERHELMYGLEKASEIKEIEANDVILIAQDFIDAVEKLLV